MRFHTISLPHTNLNQNYVSCAYSMKALKFSQMMMSLGHEVYSYAGEHSEMEATEHVVINSDAEQEKWFGKFDHHKNFYPITWGSNDKHWVESNLNAIREIQKRIQPEDIICLIAGECQRAIAEAFPNNPVVEYGVGYRGIFADFRVFESYSHMNWVYGNYLNIDDGKHYDSVIPNYFDPNDFQLTDKEDYYVFLGRFIQRKGVEIAVEATRQIGAKLIMAGQGCAQRGNKFIGEDIMVEGDHLEHIGHVNTEQRKALLSKAKACFMPTTYLEPFGGVSVEALMSGTPVIASDFGAFPEIVKHGLNGYRFRTIGEAAYYAGTEKLGLLMPNYDIRADAIERYSMDVIKYKYQDYFEQVLGAYTGKADFYSSWHGRIDRYQ